MVKLSIPVMALVMVCSFDIEAFVDSGFKTNVSKDWSFPTIEFKKNWLLAKVSCTLLVCICAVRQSLQLSHRSSRYEEHRFQLFRIWDFYNCLGILHTVELWGAPCGCDSDISQFLNQAMSRKYLMMTTSTRKGRHCNALTWVEKMSEI